MNYTLAIFKTRFATLNFASLLRANNIPVAIINTPSAIGPACGISAKFLSDYYAKIQELLIRSQIRNNLIGFFMIEKNGRFFKI